MSRTVIGLFRETTQAQSAFNELARAGFEETESFVEGEAKNARLAQEFDNAGVPEQNSRFYYHGLETNGVLLIAHATDTTALQAEEIMERNGSLKIEQGDPEAIHAGYAESPDAEAPIDVSASRSDYRGATTGEITGYSVAPSATKGQNTDLTLDPALAVVPVRGEAPIVPPHAPQGTRNTEGTQVIPENEEVDGLNHPASLPVRR